MNHVTLFGRLGHDPELRMTQGGHSVLRMRIATNHKVKRGEKWEDATEWHTCILWGKRAEGLSKHIEKGDQLLINGRLRTNEWEDREGNKRYSTEIVVEGVEFGASKRGAGAGGTTAGSARNAPPGEPDYDHDDDIPF